MCEGCYYVLNRQFLDKYQFYLLDIFCQYYMISKIDDITNQMIQYLRRVHIILFYFKFCLRRGRLKLFKYILTLIFKIQNNKDEILYWYYFLTNIKVLTIQNYYQQQFMFIKNKFINIFVYDNKKIQETVLIWIIANIYILFLGLQQLQWIQ
ncbi:unnamed protein product [Paramecium pentaurelia]|uniref:Transmembrane protein n=1 Tax=Paramecium pentaurelia TaxID=43138 RepID=A0A8S1X2S6_9CILI|nr:unnamed protein product [Paramecium pentaurelia]